MNATTVMYIKCGQQCFPVRGCTQKNEEDQNSTSSRGCVTKPESMCSSGLSTVEACSLCSQCAPLMYMPTSTAGFQLLLYSFCLENGASVHK
jgi:hypothetical protein